MNNSGMQYMYDSMTEGGFCLITAEENLMPSNFFSLHFKSEANEFNCYISLCSLVLRENRII